MGYLPKIEAIADDIIETLIEDEFFKDFEIEDYTYTRKRFCDELTTKFLLNGLEDNGISIFNEDEFDKILKEVIAEDMLRTLQKRGLINSYEDDNTEEVFFLTEKGREEMEKKPDDDDTDLLNIFVDGKI
jgi:hypothetical protein